MTGKNRIMIFGPKDDGTYIVEFKTDTLAVSVSGSEAAVLKHFQARALRACGAGRSVRNFSRAHEFAEGELLPRREARALMPPLPETPPQWESGRGSRLEKDKPLSGTRLTARALI